MTSQKYFCRRQLRVILLPEFIKDGVQRDQAGVHGVRGPTGGQTVFAPDIAEIGVELSLVTGRDRADAEFPDPAEQTAEMDDPLQILLEGQGRNDGFIPPDAAPDNGIVVPEENADGSGFPVQNIAFQPGQRRGRLVSAQTGIDDPDPPGLQIFLKHFDISVFRRGQTVAEAQQDIA